MSIKRIFIAGLFIFGATVSNADNHSMGTDAAAVHPILVGAEAPSVNVRNIDGKSVDFRSLVTGKDSVVIFYRGGWCPYCNLQLGELAKQEVRLKALGYQIIAVSPDKPAELKKSVEKNKVSYQLVSDSKASLVKAFGLGFKVDAKTRELYKGYGIDLEVSSGESHYILPAPAVYLISKEGLVTFQYVNPNYKVRLSTKVLMAAAEEYRSK